AMWVAIVVCQFIFVLYYNYKNETEKVKGGFHFFQNGGVNKRRTNKPACDGIRFENIAVNRT
ncbi:MAG: hypothetical protein OXI63_23620, partial [Candidatus Poribacteria bacterium]|nr:hypothetical protein [Candidatus Poribacteria bacterium]